jgi:hypothetical protein
MQRILILALLVASPFVQVGPGSGAAIEGAITTDGGRPLPGVKIAVDGLTKPLHFETRSDTAGHYAIENVPDGSYTVLADARGFGCVVIPKVVLESGKRLKQDFEFLHGRKKLSCEHRG